MPVIRFLQTAKTLARTGRTIARYEDRVGVFWSDPSNGYTLEASETVSSAAVWQPITGGITISDTTKIYSATNGSVATRFFGLRR